MINSDFPFLQMSEKVQRGRAYQCNECEYRGEKSWALDHHAKKHCDLDTASYACLLCKFKTGTASQLERHLAKEQHRRKTDGLPEDKVAEKIKRRNNETQVLKDKLTILSTEDSQKHWAQAGRKDKPTTQSTDKTQKEEITVQTVTELHGQLQTETQKKLYEQLINSYSNANAKPIEETSKGVSKEQQELDLAIQSIMDSNIRDVIQSGSENGDRNKSGPTKRKRSRSTDSILSSISSTTTDSTINPLTEDKEPKRKRKTKKVSKETKESSQPAKESNTTATLEGIDILHLNSSSLFPCFKEV